ncbi:MAG: hypothetical protein ABIG61_06265 [Planctomycetota bacterium]
MTKEPLKLDGVDKDRAIQIYSVLREKWPNTRTDLHNYLKVFLDVDVPDQSICAEHKSPMDYLCHCFFSDFDKSDRGNNDAVIWANRGGGKTELGAIATLLDCIFKKGCQVRILGGSLEQSNRMYEYLKGFIHGCYEWALAGPVKNRKCVFKNGSAVEVLTQSATSVRGTHVQKLRCDEVELFDNEVFAAAQFVPHSREGVNAALEMISTMHRPYGLMQKIISQAKANGTAIFKWCVWEVIEQCRDRSCSRCVLAEDCRGKAKKCKGYLRIDDCIAQMKRSSRSGWETEMLCMRPSVENVVFSDFDPSIHVRLVDYDANLPLYRSLDFGFVNPFVCLWIQVDGSNCVRVIDEYVRSRAIIASHAEQIKQRMPCGEETVAGTFCDPAGAGANDVTGTSAVRELREMGIRVRYRPSSILAGVELIRRSLRNGAGQSSLIISPKCGRLIEAMQCYHYPDNPAGNNAELPLKDGLYDHPIDALRYFFINYTSSAKTTTRRY